MSYIVFARKWRPQKFEEVIGQEHITTTLKNAIELDRIAHAYLFTGPRGIGKTSTARIFAKALNCIKGPIPVPCNKCIPCKEITAGNSMDVLEIDGASNRGIEEIRNLRENVKFMPSGGKFKIYIIDEVHMLTQEAFNALLKTLEEPPKHVKFIFATTRPHKVLPTILSRCQRFDFRKISNVKIVEKLSRIAQKEKIKINEDALFTIAKASDGSLRDAESVLDQLVNLYQRKITSTDVTKLLGVVPKEVIFNFVDNIKEYNTPKAIELINTIANEGKDISRFTIDLCEHFRNMLMVKIGANSPDLLPLPGGYIEEISQQAQHFSQPELFYIINILLDTYSKMRYASMPRIPLELAVAKLAQRDKIVGLDDILSKFDELKKSITSITDSESVKDSTYMHKNKTTKPSFKKDNPTGNIEKSRPEKFENSQVVSCLDLDTLRQKWPKILDKIKAKRMSLGTYLNEARLLNVKGNKIILGFHPESKFHKKVLEEDRNRKYIEEILKENLKGSFLLKFKQLGEGKKSTKEEKLDPKSILDHEIIKSAIDIFKGKIVFNGKKNSNNEENR